MKQVTYIKSDGSMITHPYNTADLSDFEEILSKIKDDNVRNYTQEWLQAAPEYIFTVPASSSGKYHPACDLGDGGLKRHLINTAWMLSVILELEQYKGKFNQTEIDLMISAALLHDLLKSGWQKDFEKDSRTRFDHPKLMAEAVRCKNTMVHQLPDAYTSIIADCIETHMGQWTTSSYYDGEPLKKPETEMQKLVHLADYIVSRRDITIAQNNTLYAFQSQTIVQI